MSDERQASERAVELVVALRSALLAGESRVARQELLDYIAALEADRARLDWLNADAERLEQAFGATVRHEQNGDVRAIVDAAQLEETSADE